MNAEPLRSKVTIANAQGLHMRPAKAFVELANRFQSAVSVAKGDNPHVDGRSILSLIGLGAEQGTELTLEASGPDQQEALDALVALIKEFVKEDEEEQ
jgi:phosphotransferase system HPr (HPr) family protein